MTSQSLFPLANGGRVWVFDASSIIQVKHDVRAGDQWGVLRGLEELVGAGALAFPREVAREVKAAAHPDAPGVWLAGVEGKLRHPLDPDVNIVAEVMASAAGGVVDAEKPIDGDPYVLALALQLSRAGYDVSVVTEDVNDRPNRLSMATACDHLGLRHVRLSEFLTETSE
jgi:hypothetical protein